MKTMLMLFVMSLTVWSADPAQNSTAAVAEQKKSGAIIGTVIDITDRSPIPDATVEVLGTGQKTTTAKDGQFSLSGLAEGFYQIRATANGYDQQTQNNLYFDGKGPVTAFFMLKKEGQSDDRPHSNTSPVPVSTKSPSYPEDARKNGIEGVFYFVLKISDTGAIESAMCYEKNLFAENGKLKDKQVVEKYSQFVNQLEKEATDAVWQWKFKPAMKEGKPIVSEVVLPIKFKLDGEKTDEKKGKKK